MTRTFPGLGPDTLVPVPKPSALAGLKLGAEEGFVLSRIDGKLTVGQICLLVPFDAEVTATILGQLARVGAVDIPGATLPALTATRAAPRCVRAPLRCRARQRPAAPIAAGGAGVPAFYTPTGYGRYTSAANIGVYLWAVVSASA